MTEELNVLDYRRTDLYGHLLGIFTKLNILSTLNITASQLLDFLIDVDVSYHPTPYHSFYHAADIVVILYYMLNELDAKHYLTNKQIAVLMISAICHDIGHPGFNNDFQTKTKSDLASYYHNQSILESQSIDITIDLLRKHSLLDETDLLQDLILATDMAFHYDLLEDVNQLEEETWSVGWNDDQRRRFARILLHAADISNTVRPWPISKQWSDLIVREFFRQGDAEKTAGLTVSTGMDRDLDTQASISLRFTEGIVQPYFQSLATLLPKARRWLVALEENKVHWQDLKAATPLAASLGHDTRVSMPAGTITVLSNPLQHLIKPVRIMRTSSHSTALVSPPSSELKRSHSSSLRHS
ncbi:hypothetical protein G6F43_011893 [Rhizopus delemar]|nr:hypothetical protein G6F43_011893 [Rhizopus delemar]